MYPVQFPWRNYTLFSDTACFPTIPLEFLSLGHTRNFNHGFPRTSSPSLCGVCRVRSFLIVGIQPLLSLHWHYALYLAAFIAVHKSSIIPAFKQFLSRASSICHWYLLLSSSHPYLWMTKLMRVSSNLCVLQETEKDKTSSDKHQTFKVFLANLRSLPEL